jgi:hypothetical protein
VFHLSGGFKLGSGGTIDPVTQSVAFGVGSYAIRLPAGSFGKYSSGYVYQKKVNGIFLCVFIKFTSIPGTYPLLANRWHPYRHLGSTAGDAHHRRQQRDNSDEHKLPLRLRAGHTWQQSA